MLELSILSFLYVSAFSNTFAVTAYYFSHIDYQSIFENVSQGSLSVTSILFSYCHQNREIALEIYIGSLVISVFASREQK